jgi:hypothetical protein
MSNTVCQECSQEYEFSDNDRCPRCHPIGTLQEEVGEIAQGRRSHAHFVTDIMKIELVTKGWDAADRKFQVGGLEGFTPRQIYLFYSQRNKREGVMTLLKEIEKSYICFLAIHELEDALNVPPPKTPNRPDLSDIEG